MKVRLYANNGDKQEVEIPYDQVSRLPIIIYTFRDSSYTFFRRGYAANSTTYYETEALHLPEQHEEK